MIRLPFSARKDAAPAGKPAAQGRPAPEAKAPPVPGTAVARPTPAALATARAATAAELASIDAFAGEVLSAEGGRLALPDSQRQSVAVLDNGIVLVSREAAGTTVYSAAKALIARNGYKTRITLYVDLNVIRKVNERSGRRRREAQVRVVQDDSTVAMQRKIFDIIDRAARDNCSDIRIRVQRHEADLSVRLQGVYTQLYDFPAATGHDLLRAFFVASDVSDSHYKPMAAQSARIASGKFRLPDLVQSLRLEFTPLAGDGRLLAVRLLYTDTDAPDADVDDLGYAQHHINQLRRMRRMSVGVNIICGPTGSGKSTTLKRSLSAFIRETRGEANVITIEDPPEYQIPGASQVPVANAETAEARQEAFRKAIASVLRLDPDTVMIGEIRDGQSGSLAFKAAMSGHGVWTTVHALDALSILDRLRDLGVEKFLITDHTLVTGLVAQRLVRILCPECSLPIDRNPDPSLEIHRGVLRDLLGGDYENVRTARLEGGKGFANKCPHCEGKGYVGREVVAETILTDERFMAFVAAEDKTGARRYWLSALEGLTMLEHGVGKLSLGRFDPRDLESKVGLIDTVDRARMPVIRHLLGLVERGRAALPAPAAAIAGDEGKAS